MSAAMIWRIAGAALAATIAFAHAQPAWKPDKVVEIITSSAAGGSNDQIARIASQHRIGGALANVPTFREQGIDSWVSNWRAVFGAKGITAAQIAYWEEAFAKMAATEEWKKQLEAHDWEGQFLRSREFGKYLQSEYAATRTIMNDLGLVKIQ